MRILKTNPVLTIFNSYLVDSPQPSTISYLWNFGSLLGLCLIAQIVSGILLAMHYSGTAELAFSSVEHIMRDVNDGWLVRMCHANIASFFFITVYLHISRGLYYGSYRSPRTGTWVIGTIIFFLMMATAFLGYVLPFGQMSLWGATVITNLLSAIPWLGKSLVELKNKMKYELHKINVFNIIGKISPYAIKKGWKKSIDENIFLNIPYSFLAMLTGLIDGDGYISVCKSKKNFIKISLVISLHLDDISTLNYIYSVLNLGKIKTYPKSGKKNTCKLIINKTDLQVFLFPLMNYHNLHFLTKIRSEQYHKAVYVMQNDIKLFSDIPKKNFSDIDLINTRDILELSFFENWIVGFTVAEGSFVIKNNKDACFQLKQRIEEVLFEAIKLKFRTKRKIYIDKNNLYCQLSVSNKEDIQKVINFFSFSGNHPLIGLKLLSYQKWITYLRNSKRYSGLTFPS